MSAHALADLFDTAARTMTSGDDLRRFGVPARGTPGAVALVVQPATVDEVREVVRRAYRAGVRLLPQGANTGLVGASVPPADDPCVVLSLDRLSGEPVVDRVGATAVVGAGVRLSALNEAATRHGLHLPVDLAADPAVGGMIATNTGGNRMVRHGPMRRYVLGVEVVAADEQATTYGRLGALRKDSRGLDPVNVAVGSGGALGVITRAVVALVRVPRAVRTWWLAVDDTSVTVDLLGQLDERRPGAISAFEFVGRRAMERALAARGAPPNPFGSDVPAAAVLVEWSFPDDASRGHFGDVDDDLADDVAAVFAAGLATDGRLVDPAAAWALRHGVSDALRSFGVVLGHDVSAPLVALMPMRDDAIAAIAAVSPDVEICDFGHAGDGGLHLNVLVPHELGPPAAELAGRLRAAVDEVVARHGGSYSAEHGLGPVNAARWLADTPAIEQRMIASLKEIVDPRRILGHPGHPYNLLSS